MAGLAFGLSPPLLTQFSSYILQKDLKGYDEKKYFN